MSSQHAMTIASKSGPLAAVVHLPAHRPAPVVVCCHGLLSSKDSSKYVLVGEQCSRAGIAAVRFDFSGCGESPAVGGGSLLDSRRRDLEAVLQYIARQDWQNGIVGLLGSSLGGYLALLAAAAAGPIPVRAVACWATPFDLSRVRQALKGSSEVAKMLPAGMELGAPVNLDDLPAVERVLVVHGQQDEIVPWREALAIYRQAGEPKRLLLMQRAEHRLLDPHCRQLALNATLSWFAEQGLTAPST